MVGCQPASVLISPPLYQMGGSRWGSAVGRFLLRDTTALDSFILESVLLFSSKTDTGRVIPLGLGIVMFSVHSHGQSFVWSC